MIRVTQPPTTNKQWPFNHHACTSDAPDLGPPLLVHPQTPQSTNSASPDPSQEQFLVPVQKLDLSHPFRISLAQHQGNLGEIGPNPKGRCGGEVVNAGPSSLRTWPCMSYKWCNVAISAAVVQPITSFFRVSGKQESHWSPKQRPGHTPCACECKCIVSQSGELNPLASIFRRACT